MKTPPPRVFVLEFLFCDFCFRLSLAESDIENNNELRKQKYSIPPLTRVMEKVPVSSKIEKKKKKKKKKKKCVNDFCCFSLAVSADE